MSSTRFEPEGSSSVRRLYVQLWYGTVQYGNRIDHTHLHTGLLVFMHVKCTIP
jgi:hypothetical protein